VSLRLESLKKSFGGFSLELSFSIEDSDILILAGPSGCGKTTAVNLIAGLMPADSGEIFVGGREISALSAWERNMGVVFQDLALFPHLDVGGNIEYGLKVRRIPKKIRRETVAALLKTVHLENYEKRRIDTLSGGEKQRVAISRALAINPGVLLFDEPFSGLDAPLRRGLAAEFLEIKKRNNIPWVFVSHNEETTRLLGSKIALLDKGTIVEFGTKDKVLNRPETRFASEFFRRER